MKSSFGLAFAVVIVATASALAAEPAPIIVFDAWWAIDYAKSSCLWSQGYDKRPTVPACIDPTLEVRQFQEKLATQFAANKECHGISFARYFGFNDYYADAMRKGTDWIQAHWSLRINYNPGAQKQSWILFWPSVSNSVEDEGEAKEIVANVCAIVNGRGATVQ